MDSDYYQVKVVSANIYIPRDHYLGDITEVANNLIIKQGRGSDLGVTNFNDISGDVIVYMPTSGLISNTGIVRDINISNNNLIRLLEIYINYNKALYDCQRGYVVTYFKYFQIKMGLDKATNNDQGQDLIIYRTNGAVLTFEYYWEYLG